MFALKEYQRNALAALDGFFFKVRTSGLDVAWRACAPMHERNGQIWQANYDPTALGDVPAECVRIPTSGGKTFLAAHAVALVGKTLQDTAAPVALWLVPSDEGFGQVHGNRVAWFIRHRTAPGKSTGCQRYCAGNQASRHMPPR